MKDLIPTINQIVRFGIQPNLTVNNSDEFLERNLIKIYNLYFDIEFEFDETEYPDFDKSKLPDIRQNIETNFKNFGLYKTFFVIENLSESDECLIGDAFDDLTDIIIDLLEIKWRIESNSIADGLWFFEMIFYIHTKQHIINLLNYLKRRND